MKPHKNAASGRSIIAIPPIFFISLAFAIGVGFGYQIQFSFVFISILTLLGLSLLGFLTKREPFKPVSIFVFFLVGILFGSSDRIISERDIAILASEGPITLEGIVVTVPETTLKGRKETVSFVLSSQNFFRKGHFGVVKTIGKVQVFLYNPAREINFGDQLRLRGVLEIPAKARNPHSFDYAGYLAKSGIRRIFRGIGRYSVLHQRNKKENLFLVTLNQVRVFLRKRIETLLPSPQRELASALVLGFRKNVPREIKDAFIRTGTAHLLAISGLHISLVGGLFYFLIRFTGLGRTFHLILTAVFIAFYVVLAGANFPVLRAGIMGIMIALGLLFGADRNSKNTLFFTFFILLAVWPSALFNVSFQLSFIAMASLVFVLPRFERMLLPQMQEETVFRYGPWHAIWSKVRRSSLQTLLASVAVTVGMLPFLAFYFNLFSWVGFLANIFIVPVCTASIALTLVLLAADLVFPPLAVWFRFVPVVLYKLELELVQLFASVPLGHFYVPSPPWFAFPLYYGFLAAWLFLPAHCVKNWIRTSCLAGIGVVSIVFSAAWKPPAFEATFFDLGRSSHAAYFSFSDGGNLLINTGRHFPGDQAYWVLRPFFMGSQVQRLDAILITKLDGFHAGGFRTLKNHINVQKLLTPSGDRDTKRRDKYIGLNRNGNDRIGFVSHGDLQRFGPEGKGCVEILVFSPGQVLAFKVQDGNKSLLYLSSSKPEVFERLIESREFDFDIVFIPNQEFLPSAAQEEFFKRSSIRFVISNQRGFLSEFRTRFKAISNSKLFFLKESGAARIRFSGRDVELVK